MAVELHTEQVYTDWQASGIAVVVACGTLSSISVLGMFVILGISAIRHRHSSSETPFVRTNFAIFFLSLLMCNLVQGVDALLNIQWILKKRVHIGTLCTAQAALKQIGNIGAATFSFVIAAHTFSLLFLRRRWSDRTRYVVLIASWSLLFLDLCIDNFFVADPVGRGPYYGIAGYWCWVTPPYSTEGYCSEYLFMSASFGFSFILYLLVFLRLRGNVTLSGGYKVHFHPRPKVRVGITSTGTYISTDDRRVESHLTTVAKQMLWYPFAYTILVLPIGASQYSTTSGASVPFPVIVFSAALFMLSGFVNTVLFCATRSVLPGHWRHRFNIGTTLSSERAGITLSTWGNSPWRPTESGIRKGAVAAGRSSFVIDVSVEKNVEIKYDNEPSISSLKFSSLASPTSPLRAYSGRQRADGYNHHIRRPSVLPLRDERNSISLGVDEEGDDSDLNGAHQARRPNGFDATTSRHPSYASRTRESGISESAMGLEAPASVYPFFMGASRNTDMTQPWSPSILTSGAARNQAHLSRASGDFGGNGSDTNWKGYDGRLPQSPHTGVYHSAGGE